MDYIILNNELYHHGIKGQKWGIRRYQNADGSLTAAGKRKYGTTEALHAKKDYKNAKRAYAKSFGKARVLNAPNSVFKKRREASDKRWDDVRKKAITKDEAKQRYMNTKKESKNEKVKALNEPSYKNKINTGKAVTLAIMAMSGAYALSTVGRIDKN